jgi:hypothetical protein
VPLLEGDAATRGPIASIGEAPSMRRPSIWEAEAKLPLLRWGRRHREASEAAREPTISAMQEVMRFHCWSRSCFAIWKPPLSFLHRQCRCLLETV